MSRWDDRLREYIEQELGHLWKMGSEFAAQNPNVADKLRLKTHEEQDPFVERLLDGFAFLTARVRMKMDEEFPRFTESLIETLHPQFLAPMPAMTIVQFTPDSNVPPEGHPVHRSTRLIASNSSSSVDCVFTTAHHLTLHPIKVSRAQYVPGPDLEKLSFPQLTSQGKKVEAAICITLETTVKDLKFNALSNFNSVVFHLNQMPQTPIITLYEQLFAHGMQAWVRGVGARAGSPVQASRPRRVGFDDQQSLIPPDARSFPGYRLLAEYFVLPQRFLFFEIAGLGNMALPDSNRLEIVIPLRKEDRRLQPLVSANNFLLFCSPAINLFKSDIKIQIDPTQSEFALIPLNDPQDCEVYQVEKLVARATARHGANTDEQEFLPFYRLRDVKGNSRRYFSVHRTPNRFDLASTAKDDRAQFLSANERSDGRRRNNQAARLYRGSDVHVCLVDGNLAPFSPSLETIVANALCTNRGLTLTLQPGEGSSDFEIDGLSCDSVRCVDQTITSPRPSPANGEFTWRLINHLAGNYLSLATADPTRNAKSLKNLLVLYSVMDTPDEDPRVNAVLKLTSESDVGRIAAFGQLGIVRGIKLSLQLDENAFGRTGAFVLGAVLEEFFRKYASINSFTRTTLTTQQRGDVYTWPARSGHRHLL